MICVRVIIEITLFLYYIDVYHTNHSLFVVSVISGLYIGFGLAFLIHQTIGEFKKLKK